MGRRGLSLALAIVPLSGNVRVVRFPGAPPENAGLSSERLQHVTAVQQSEVDRDRIPGAVIAVARIRKLCEQLGQTKLLAPVMRSMGALQRPSRAAPG